MANFDDTKVRFTSLGSVKSGEGMEPIKVKKLTITPADLDAAATSDTVTFSSVVPNGAILIGFAHNLRQVFAGGSVATCVLNLGDGSNPDRFIDNVNIFTGASTGFVAQTADAVGDGADSGGLPLAIAADLTLTATVTTSAANVTALTTGALDIYCYYIFPEDPTA